LDINTKTSFKVKRRTLVITSCETTFSSKERARQKEEVYADHVKVQEINDLNANIELAKVLETLEDRGEAMLDELKELNLRDYRRTTTHLCEHHTYAQGRRRVIETPFRIQRSVCMEL